jgi:hypothetical protein
MSSKKKEFDKNSLENLKKIYGDELGTLIYERRKKSTILNKPDNITFTSYSGEQEIQKWEMFDLQEVRFQVRNRIILHNAYTHSLNVLPQADKYDYWYDNMYKHEKMITNYTYLGVDYPQYEFDIKEIDVHKDYRPIYNDATILKVNSFIYPYDEGVITWDEYLDTCYHYFKDYFPDDFKERKELIDNLTQAQVDDMLDSCLKNYTYELNQDEIHYSSNKEYAKKVSRWLDKKFKEFRVDIDSHFTRFEIVLQNNPQPTYKLGSIFNPQLAQMTLGDYKKQEKSKEGRLHPIVLEYLENRFKDWFAKKYATLGDDLKIESIYQESLPHFFSSKKRKDIKWVKSK